MKISIIGAGNVGGLTAMRLAQLGIREVLLIDVKKGLAKAKTLDLEDSTSLIKNNAIVKGSEDIKDIKGSDIVVIAAGLARQPGMTREELLKKNAGILQDICREIKNLTEEPLVIVVTNPVDILTNLVIKKTGFDRRKVLGIGVNLDAARFTNLISKELNIPHADIDTLVIGAHGETMLPLTRFSYIKGVQLDEFLNEKQLRDLTQKTLQRGAEIVSLLGSGSAYFAPSAAIVDVIKAIAKDEKRTIALSSYLNGEYGTKDICIGVPCRIGRDGTEEIIQLNLNKEEKESFLRSVESLKKQQKILNGTL